VKERTVGGQRRGKGNPAPVHVILASVLGEYFCLTILTDTVTDSRDSRELLAEIFHAPRTIDFHIITLKCEIIIFTQSSQSESVLENMIIPAFNPRDFMTDTQINNVCLPLKQTFLEISLYLLCAITWRRVVPFFN
jgi:hypothetical protein